MPIKLHMKIVILNPKSFMIYIKSGSVSIKTLGPQIYDNFIRLGFGKSHD